MRRFENLDPQDEESYPHTVNVHINSLRRKIDSGHELKLIQTVHRMGYMLKRPDPEDLR